MSSGLSYDQLSITQNGDDVYISDPDEILAIVNDQATSNITILDFVTYSSGALTLTGTSASESLIGGVYGDTISTGTGNDTVVGWGGDDEITVNGSGSKSISGGAGDDSVTISIAGVDSLSDFSVSMDGDGVVSLTRGDDVITLTDVIDDTPTGRNLDDGSYGSGLTVGAYDYVFLDSPESWNDYGRSSMHDGSLGHTQGVVYSSGEASIVLFEEEGNGYATFHSSRVQDSGRIPVDLETTATTVYGSGVRDFVSTSTKDDTINTGAGNDQVYARQGSDTVSLGAGDDVFFLTYSALNEDASIDGGDGSDTLHFNSIQNLDAMNAPSETFSAITLNMNTLGNASGFENIVGSDYADTITGDSGANVIAGVEGSDTIYGGAGDDTLYAAYITSDTSGATYGLRSYDVSSTNHGNDSLYGQAGNDTLVGGNGDDVLDGGAGADTLTGGSGSDTFVLRSGDGGETSGQADVVTDFFDGKDIFGLDDGLLYSQLTIEQGSGDYANDTVISYEGEYLVRVVGVASNDFGEVDFEPVNIL